MKHIFHTIKITGAALLVYGGPSNAAVTPFYLNLDIGPTFIPDVQVRNSLGNQAAFDTGVGGNLCAGYHLNHWLATELETGVLWNSIDRIGAVSLSQLHSRADLYQIPLKLNLVCNIPTKTRWTPYLGGGVGAMFSVLDSHVDPVPSQGPNRAASIPVGNHNFTDTDCTLAYQAIAGLKYNISPHAQIDLGYKFFGTTDHTWNDRNGGQFRTGPIYTHAVALSFTWRF